MSLLAWIFSDIKKGLGVGFMDSDYIKKLQTMKLSEAIEEIYGIKLLQYQKIMVDKTDKTQTIDIKETENDYR